MNTEPQDYEDGQLTVWNVPNELMRTQYGFITYAEWCNHEVARMGLKSGMTVKFNDKGECCVAKV